MGAPKDRPVGAVCRAERATLEEYAERWLRRRRALRPRSAETDAGRLALYALPAFGARRLSSIRPAELRDWVAGLASRLSPRTARRAYATLAWVLRDAAIDGILASSPAILGRDALPAERDADPEWRDGAVFSGGELGALVSDPRVPHVRRALWALLGFAGLRISEAAGLRWTDLTDDRPLRCLRVARQWDPARREMVATKTRVVRRVPVHPALDDILTAWRTGGYAPHAGRLARDDDLIVPTSAGSPFTAYNANRRLAHDCAELGLRRGTPHWFRRSFLTLARESGCDLAIVRIATHARSRDVIEQYTRTGWARLCSEISRIAFRVEKAGPGEGGQLELPLRLAHSLNLK
jgi:integrase